MLLARPQSWENVLTNLLTPNVRSERSTTSLRSTEADRVKHIDEQPCGLTFEHEPHEWFDGDHDLAYDRRCPGVEDETH